MKYGVFGSLLFLEGGIELAAGCMAQAHIYGYCSISMQA